MTEFLRLLGIWNAAIWLGSTVFYVLFGSSLPHSEAMIGLLGRNSEYFRVAVGQILASKYHSLQLICAIVAVVQTGSEWLFFGRRPPRVLLATLGASLLCVLFSAGLARTQMTRLNITSHAVNVSPAHRAQAAASFNAWQTTTKVDNLLLLGLLAFYFSRMNGPTGTSRFLSTSPFRS